jgi:hypothetical protein
VFTPPHVPQLLSALSDALGQPIDIDEEDECVLEFEGPVEVVLAQAPDAEVLSFRSALTGAGQPLEPELLRRALAFNYTSMPPGCSIALDDTAPQLVLVALVDAERTSPDALLSVLSGFVELVPQLRKWCEAAQGAVEPETGDMGVIA